MPLKFAGLSIDVDSVSTHLAGYGVEPLPDDGKAYTIAIPRILRILRRHGAKATFFLVAEEAKRHPDVIAEVAVDGHEIASHSMTHRLPFRSLSDYELKVEVLKSKQALESLAGEPVVGFRAPSWDIDERILDAIREAGYQYDSSSYPSILLPLLRWAIARQGGSASMGEGSAASVWGRIRPHRLGDGGEGLVEIPMCVVPIVRLPYYHTMRFVMPDPVFRALRTLVDMRTDGTWYQFHTTDFLDIDRDELDSRISRHPGMDLSLDRKISFAEEAIEHLAAGASVMPLASLVERLPVQEAGMV